MAKLEGMTQICEYVRRTESTVLGYIRLWEFPAFKLNSIWISDTRKIDDWYLGLVENSNGDNKKNAKTENGKKTRKKRAKKTLSSKK